jgi:hypothetical protein
MAIRYLVAALLVGSAFSANAGVLPLAVGNPSYATTAGGNALVGVYNGRRVAVAGGVPSHAVYAPAPAASAPAPAASAPAPAALPPAPVVYTPAPAVSAPPETTSGGQGNGAIVTLPTGAGNQGPAVVQLPIPAQAAHGGDVGAAPPPVTLPSGPAAAVPEPSSVALLMAGMLGGLGVARRRKR